ncbi:MAG: class I SAM-dependent methyltransferase [Candidatus Binatia bacterium]
MSEISNPLSLYEDLEDPSYDEGRGYRSLQCQKLLEVIRKYKSRGRLLDIGAGTGIMLEEAAKLGFVGCGVEPSQWLSQKASERGLQVFQGTYPHKDITGAFDVVTLVNVLEHVTDPVGLLRAMSKAMADDGIGFVVTPDVSSFARKLLRWRWWHFRVAHIGYFDKRPLTLALDKAGLQLVAFGRPGWYFSASYLVDRLNQYLPTWIHLPSFAALRRLIIPLNLKDSLYVIFRRKA